MWVRVASHPPGTQGKVHRPCVPPLLSTAAHTHTHTLYSPPPQTDGHPLNPALPSKGKMDAWGLLLSWPALLLAAALAVASCFPVQRWRYRHIKGPMPLPIIGNLPLVAQPGGLYQARLPTRTGEGGAPHLLPAASGPGPS